MATKTAKTSSKGRKSASKKEVSVEELVGITKSTPIKKPVKSKSTKTAKQSLTYSKPNQTNSPTRPVLAQRDRQYSSTRFNGVVDNRRIPDADVPTEVITGILDLEPNGHGILRPDFVSSDRDIYISSSQIRRFRLRPGDKISGPAREPKENERYWGLLKVEKVNDIKIEDLGERPSFDKLTPIYPNEQIKLETESDILSTRLIDLISPIGKGQRGLIVSPPKAGKTTILKQIANGISKNHKDIHIVAVLVGERPEEVTDIKHSIKGEVIASNFDEPAEHQARTAEIALERAKRIVEMGKDVVVLLDSITRLARAYNLAIPTSGRTLSGGFDPAALYPPKKFFGAARNFEPFDTAQGKKGGSLTVLGTALVETGSRMDELIYEEFKGTGNMEIHLDRKLEQRRIFPAINVQKSGTRQEQLLYNKGTYEKIVTLRRMLDILSKEERTEVLLTRLKKTKTNKEFLDSLGKG